MSSQPSPSDSVRRVRALVSGRVQGVGFRYFIQRRAVELNLTGWVANRPDATVEIIAEGPAESINALLKAARVGPPAAYVRDLKFTEETPRGDLPDPFTIRSSSWY